MDPDQKRKANKNAMVNMLKYAWYDAQTYIGAFMCTLCLRLIAVHGYNQENKTGPARHNTEYWLERHIGDHKKAFRRHGITKNPGLYAANRYLRKVKIANFLADSSVRDLRNEARKDARRRSPTASADDKTVYDGHFLGNGTTMDKDFDWKSELIEAAMQRYPELLRKDDIELIKKDIELIKFQSASKWGEVFHSNEYTRSSSSKRSSRHVSFVPGIDQVERQFGEVNQYWMFSYEDVKIRMCELQHHVKTTNELERYLDHETVRLSEPEQKFVALKDTKQKCFSPRRSSRTQTNVKAYRWCHSAASLPTKRDMLCIIEINGASSLIAHLLDSVHAAPRGTLGGGGGEHPRHVTLAQKCSKRVI